MTQNIYDHDDFFQAYSQLPRSVQGLEGAPEWPSLRAMVPDLRGLRVLDLGCGFGWFCRWAAEQGAASVVGIDVSEKMLARAAAMTAAQNVTYRLADLEDVELRGESFDLVYSSLAFHYIRGLDALFEKIHGALVPGGRLVFSAEHPLYTAPSKPGWVVDADGRRTWPIDSYLVEGARSTNWLAEGVIKQHRTIATYVKLLIARGFAIVHVEEWCPTDEQIAAQPDLAEERDRPTFLLVAANRL